MQVAPAAFAIAVPQFVHVLPQVLVPHACSQPFARLPSLFANDPVQLVKSHVPPAVQVNPLARSTVVGQAVHVGPQSAASHPCSQPFARFPSQSEKFPLHAP